MDALPGVAVIIRAQSGGARFHDYLAGTEEERTEEKKARLWKK
jgi:hypothetical protein